MGHFRVNLIADPTPIIQWYSEDSPISSGGRYTISTETDGTNYMLQLIPSNVNENENGLYKVHVCNSHGESNTNFNLNIAGLKKKPAEMGEPEGGEGETKKKGKKKVTKKKDAKEGMVNGEKEDDSSKQAPVPVIVEPPPPEVKVDEAPNDENGEPSPDPKAPPKRRGSRVPDDEEEVSFMFVQKPENTTIDEGKDHEMVLELKEAVASVKLFKGDRELNSPRVTLTYDASTKIIKINFKKAKTEDEAKYQINLCGEDGKVVDFAGFSTFVKDPKSGGMDFRNLLKHKDTKKRKGVDDGIDVNLKSQQKEQEEKEKARR